MKELTIEEKAKAYDKAIERARYWEKNPTVWSSDDICQKLFPELKESEGERIRKELIEFVKSRGGFKQEYIAWLEKQGEQKPNYCHHEVDMSGCSEEYRKAYYDGWNNCNQQHAQLEAEQSHWSEEDEETLKDIITSMTNLKDSATSDALRYIYNSKIDWLKSLKERYTWKPSDEQMLAINTAINVLGKGTLTGKYLIELHEQLKKLRDDKD